MLGATTLPGNWNLIPAANNRLFALGEDYGVTAYQSLVSLEYVDVSTPTAPQVLGTASFGAGWSWTPAADTFKAFGMDPTGLVVLPFSGWDPDDYGVQHRPPALLLSTRERSTAGIAHTHGWVDAASSPTAACSRSATPRSRSSTTRTWPRRW